MSAPTLDEIRQQGSGAGVGAPRGADFAAAQAARPAAAMTERDIQRELEEAGTAIPMYNPSSEWFHARYNGADYHFPPDGEAQDPATGRMREFDGILLVRDYWGFEWAKAQEDGPLVNTGARKMFHSAVAAVKHITAKHGQRGLVRLTGDPVKDEAIKDRARKVWMKFHINHAQAVIMNREAYLKQFHASPGNAGQIPNPPTQQEEGAYEVMASYRLGEIGRKKHACPHDGYQTDDQAKFERHNRAFHPDLGPAKGDEGAGDGARRPAARARA